MVMALAVKVVAVVSQALCEVTRTRWPTMSELKLTPVSPRLWKVVWASAVTVTDLLPLASLTTKVEFWASMEEMVPVAQTRVAVERVVVAMAVGVDAALEPVALALDWLRKRTMVKPRAPSAMIPTILMIISKRLLINIERFS